MFRKQRGAKGGGVAAAGLKDPQRTGGDLEESLAQLTVTGLSTPPTHSILQTANLKQFDYIFTGEQGLMKQLK